MAVAAGADALGFVFWPGSPRARRLPKSAAPDLAPTLPPFVAARGRLRGRRRATSSRAPPTSPASTCSSSTATSRPEALAGLPRRVLKALRVGPAFSRRGRVRLRGAAAAGLLLDTHRPGSPGRHRAPSSTGRGSSGLRERVPFLVLAGGLTPDNVADAIEAVQPHGVDVSSGSGVEPGRKDPALCGRSWRPRGALGEEELTWRARSRRRRPRPEPGRRRGGELADVPRPDAAGRFGPYGGRYVPET